MSQTTKQTRAPSSLLGRTILCEELLRLHPRLSSPCASSHTQSCVRQARADARPYLSNPPLCPYTLRTLPVAATKASVAPLLPDLGPAAHSLQARLTQDKAPQLLLCCKPRGRQEHGCPQQPRRIPADRKRWSRQPMHPGSLGLAAHLGQAESRWPAGYTVLFLLRNNPWLRRPCAHLFRMHSCNTGSHTVWQCQPLLSAEEADGRCSCGVHQGR